MPQVNLGLLLYTAEDETDNEVLGLRGEVAELVELVGGHELEFEVRLDGELVLLVSEFLQRPRRLGRQPLHFLFAFTQAQFPQRPVALHLQQLTISRSRLHVKTAKGL